VICQPKPGTAFQANDQFGDRPVRLLYSGARLFCAPVALPTTTSTSSSTSSSTSTTSSTSTSTPSCSGQGGFCYIQEFSPCCAGLLCDTTDGLSGTCNTCISAGNVCVENYAGAGPCCGGVCTGTSPVLETCQACVPKDSICTQDSDCCAG